MSASEWYVKIDSRTRGPLSGAALRRAAERGSLARSTLVRRGAAGPWVVASQIRGLFPQEVEKRAESIKDENSYSALPSILAIAILLVCAIAIASSSYLLTKAF
jgi:hypothetical protein